MEANRLWSAVARIAVACGMLGAMSMASQAQTISGEAISETGPMEGILVTAKKEGSTIAYTVVSDASGRFSFPVGKLESGEYTLRVRAVGFDLEGANREGVLKTSIDATQIDKVVLKLKKTRNLAVQLTNAEWIMSVPGTEDQKSQLLNCVGCHTLERIVRSTHDANEFTEVVHRMWSYAQVSQPIKPQKRMDPERVEKPESYRAFAEYLASINLSQAENWDYPLQTLPRPTGRATKVLITEYALPRPTIEPHDVILDSEGLVWYTNFGEQFLGRLNPKNGATSEIPLPEFKKGYPVGSLDIESDKAGNLWIGMMYQGAVAKFDPATEQFRFYRIPKKQDSSYAQLNMLGLGYQVDGKIWTNNAGNQEIYRIDLASGAYETVVPLKQFTTPGPHVIYGIASDSKNNLWFMEFLENYIGKIDAKTLNINLYRAPTDLSRNRRGIVDAQDNLWFTEYRGNKIGMFNTHEESFKEWPLPTPWSGPYHPAIDKNGEVWTGGMTTDRVIRLDPKTGQTVEYLMPKDTNIRRVYVDNTTTPVTFWTGSNHGASIIKVEPLD
jgi:virginiamycin B lyase